MHQTIYLSDGKECEVRTLGIFDLDQIQLEITGPFTYKLVTGEGREIEVEFDPAAYPEPPQKPEVPEGGFKHGTPEWYQMYDWELYQGALAHIANKRRAINDYYWEIARYIVKNCIAAEDAYRIVTGEDWQRVYEAALVPQLTMADVKAAVRSTYGATYKGEDVMEVLERMPPGPVSYNTIRGLENKLMVSMNLTEVDYALLSVTERARKVVALFLDDLLAYIESVERSKRGKSKTVRPEKSS